MKNKNIFKFVISILAPQLAGGIGSIFTSNSISGWYTKLIRPELAPPNWVFGPVWTTLFLLMGISAFLVWKNGVDKKEVKVALGVFLIQLILNTTWSILFFGLQNPALAFAEIIVLWLFIGLNILKFYKISKLAGWLLVPYLLWVSFASYLNYAFWMLN